jgi:hypothetical protein
MFGINGCSYNHMVTITALASATAKFCFFPTVSIEINELQKTCKHIVIRNYAKKPKMTIFRNRKMLETRPLWHHGDVIKITKIYYVSFRDPRCFEVAYSHRVLEYAVNTAYFVGNFEAILHLKAMRLNESGCHFNERQSFELSENQPENSNIFFSFLRKSRLKLIVFNKNSWKSH